MYVFVECCGSKCRRFYGESSRLMFGFLEVVEGCIRNLARLFWSCGLSQTGSRAPPRNSSRP
jgi:hypothetical protein